MRFRRAGLQFWAILTVLWLCASAVVAGSAYSEVNLADQVKLEQQAKDIRAAGGDPANYQWGGTIQLGAFTVPAVQLETPYFWQAHGKQYGLLAASLPVTSLIVLETIARLLEAMQELRASARARRTESPVAS